MNSSHLLEPQATPKQTELLHYFSYTSTFKNFVTRSVKNKRNLSSYCTPKENKIRYWILRKVSYARRHEIPNSLGAERKVTVREEGHSLRNSLERASRNYGGKVKSDSHLRNVYVVMSISLINSINKFFFKISVISNSAF